MPIGRKAFMLKQRAVNLYYRRAHDKLFGGHYNCPNCLNSGTLNWTVRGKPGNFKFIFSCTDCHFRRILPAEKREDVIDIYNAICDEIRQLDVALPAPSDDLRALRLVKTTVRMK